MKKIEALAEQARNYHESYLNALPNVIGTGIVSRDEKKPASKQIAVAVYVTKKKPKELLKKNELIPEYLEIQEGGHKRKVPVRVIEQGHVNLEEELLGKEPL